MTPKLYKAADVCEMAQLQPYVLRSWEKEFPGIGLRRSEDGPRLYRQSDVEQVLQLKQLVFGEGLTLAGAHRRLEAAGPAGPGVDVETTEALDMLGQDVRDRIAQVRDGLRSLLALLGAGNGASAGEYQLTAPSRGSAKRSSSRGAASRGGGASRSKTGGTKPSAKDKRRVASSR